MTKRGCPKQSSHSHRLNCTTRASTRLFLSTQESYSQQIILDDWYKFSEPGEYVVSLAIGKSRRCLGLSFEFKVVPMDAEVRLEKRSAPEEFEVIRIALVRFPAP